MTEGAYNSCPLKSEGGGDLGEIRIAGSPGDIAEFVQTSDGEVPTWDEATKRFCSRLRADSPHSPRFSREWARATWKRLLSLDEDFRSWAEYTAMITLTGQTEYPGNVGPIPPCTHLTRLFDSRRSRRQALSRSLSNIENWRRITVIGFDNQGYGHLHIALYLDEPVDPDELEPVCRAHVKNSPIAEWSGQGSDSRRVEQVSDPSDPTGLIGYLGLNIPGLDTRAQNKPGVLTEPIHRIRGSCILEAGGWQALRTPRVST